MKADIQPSHNLVTDVTLTFSSEDIEKAYTKAYQNAASKVKVNGFRPGKAPLDIVKKTLGNSVAEDAIEIMLKDSLKDVIPKLSFVPMREPKLKIEKFEKEQEMIAVARFEEPPKVHLGNYKSIRLPEFSITVEDSDIEDSLQRVRFDLAKTQARESGESVEDTDLIEYDLTSKDSDGTVVQTGEKVQYYLGRVDVNKDLEKFFIGMKAGESKEFDYAYPEDYPNKSLSGRNLKFSVTIHSVFKVIIPELDDDNVNEWNETVKTVAELKDRFKSFKMEYAERQLQSYYRILAFNAVRKESEIQIPETMIDDEMNSIFHDAIHENNLEHMSMEEFAKKFDIDMDKMKETYRKRAILNLENSLVHIEIAKAENLTVSETELKAEMEYELQRYQQTERKKIDPIKLAQNLHYGMLLNKARKFIVDNAERSAVENITLSKMEKLFSEPLED